MKKANVKQIQKFEAIQTELRELEEVAKRIKALRNGLDSLGVDLIRCSNCQNSIYLANVRGDIHPRTLAPDGWSLAVCCNHCCHNFYCASCGEAVPGERISINCHRD